MVCSICQEDYTDQKLIDDFKDGICLPCTSQKDFEEFERQCADQLEKWNKKTGNSYSVNREVTKEELMGFPLLKETLDFTNMIKEERKADRENIQLDLFNELPF